MLVLGALIYSVPWVEPVDEAKSKTRQLHLALVGKPAAAAKATVSKPEGKPVSTSAATNGSLLESGFTFHSSAWRAFITAVNAPVQISIAENPTSKITEMDAFGPAHVSRSRNDVMERFRAAQRSFLDQRGFHADRKHPVSNPEPEDFRTVSTGSISGNSIPDEQTVDSILPQNLFVTAKGSERVISEDVVHNGEPIVIEKDNTITYTGDLHGAGGFTGEGVVAFAGQYRPGNSPAIVSLSNQVIFTSTNTLIMEIGGLTPGPGTPTDNGYDQLLFSFAGAGQVTWGGALVIDLINSFQPQLGQSFNLFDFNNTLDAGAFSSITLAPGDTLDFDFTFDLSQLYNTGVITVVPEPGSISLIGAAMIGALSCRRKRR